MTAQQATIFQWSICGCILVWLVAVLVVTWQLHKETPAQPYNIEDEASRVARAAWQKTEAQ